ncbi:GctA: glutaconate CoA-transferase, subunit A [Desulfosarcina variabilis str. Montpellier]|uniref:CoA transferase subunit A n=1 Tax=Desulfosarcina variabilis TaxID=2300 RepID=UPI003AFA77B6
MKVLEEGNGRLFTCPDPDHAREYFRTKSRRQTNKEMALKDAIAAHVHDGDYLGIGGFGANRTPIAACHEIVRQGRKNMGFAGHTATHDMQILSAGEVYNRLDIAYVVGLEARGLSKCSRKYIESGKVQLTEWTNYLLAIRLQAAARNVPFLTARVSMGTDTFKYSAAKIVACPYTGKKTVIVPALYPDVAVIHVHEADVYGNARFSGISVADLELAGASKRVIITAERLISNKEIRKNPHQTHIPYYLVDAVCHVPYGGYPGTMPGEYFSDEDHLKDWLDAEKDPDTFKAFIDRNIYGCKDHQAYIDCNGGMEKVKQLRKMELLLHREGNA